MNIKKNIKNLHNKFLSSYPWIRSREELIIRIFIDSIIILILLNKDNLIEFQIFKLFLSFVLLIIWTSFSYIIGRYEKINKSSKDHLLKELILILFPLSIINITNFILIFSIYEYKVSILGIDNNFLLCILSFLLQTLAKSNIFNNNFKKENWIYITDFNNYSAAILNDILSLSRVDINIKFIKSDQIEIAELEKTNGIIIDDIHLLMKKDTDLLYKIKYNNIKILSTLEWSGIILQRYPKELLCNDDITIKELLLKVNNNKFEIRLKRISEFFISSILLFLCIPIIVIFGLLIKFEDGGPIFYSQMRTGFKGEEFKIFKMRTMQTDSEKNGPVWSSKNDNRITKIGGFLRKSRFDELPQLLLVITGKLSLIGPRPERPTFDKLLQEKIPNYRLRYLMKPGLSGWAQVNYPYGASEKDAQNKLSFDLYYINNFSTLIDLLILFKTIKLVFNRKGAIAQN